MARKIALLFLMITCIFPQAYAQGGDTTITSAPPPPPPSEQSNASADAFQQKLMAIKNSQNLPGTIPAPPTTVVQPTTINTPEVMTQPLPVATTTEVNTTNISTPTEKIPPPPFIQENNNPFAPSQKVLTPTETATLKENPSSPKIHYFSPRHKPLTYEESQQAMLDTLPVEAMPPTEEANAAFNTMLQQNTPLSAHQVVKLHQEIDLAQRAAAVPPTVPPKPVSTTLMINLAPGTTPPAIRLSVGYVSSLVFIDSAGAPWPIAAFDIGNPKAVNLQWDGKSNILFLQAVSPYSNGDIVVRLVGLPTPITLELVSGQRVVDYRVDMHVPGFGPDTKEVPVGVALPNGANQILLGVLDGVAPQGSRQVNVIGADAQAWVLGETMYLRTRLTLLSPGWVGKMVSPDGTNAYELQKASSVLVSRYGEPIELKVEGF